MQDPGSAMFENVEDKSGLRGHGATLLFALLAFALLVLTRLAHLGTPPSYDELYHVLAAQSWQSDRTLALYQGSYERTPLYTMFTAWMFDLAGGPDLAMARLPNVVLGALLSTAAILWTRMVAGQGAALIVAFLVLFWPSGIHLSQTIRFYALHGFLFFVGAVSVYALVQAGRGLLVRIVLLGLALVSLWVARQFQDSTLVGVLGLGLWISGLLAMSVARRFRHGLLILTAVAGLLLTGLIATAGTGILEAHWAKYTMSPWGHDVTLYHRVFSQFYPLFWTLTPVLAVTALRAFPGPAGFCATLVSVGLVVHSFAGVQNIRYVYYLSPFLFALWAMGLRPVLPAVIRAMRAAAAAVMGSFAHRHLVTAVLVLLGLFAALAQDAVPTAVRLMKGNVAPPMVRVSDWSEARETVRTHAADGALVVATNELAALYYLGGFDVVFSKNWVPEMAETEFARDPRTGRPLISRTDSLAQLVATYPEGIFIASPLWWSQWPRNNHVGHLMQAFERPQMDMTMAQVGSLWILHWTSTAPPDQGAEAQRIRRIVEPGRWRP